MARPASRRRVDALAATTGAVLLLLGSVAAWAVTGLWAATEQVGATTARVGAYQHLQDAVSAQAFAEAGYRRGPSPAARLRLDAAVVEVDHGVAQLHEAAEPGEGAMLSYLTVLNSRYVDETRRTLDDPVPQGADDRVAGPALDAVQQLVHAATVATQADVDAAVERQRRLVRSLAAVLPVVLGTATVTLVLGVRATRVRARRLSAAADAARRRSLTDPLTGLLNRAGFDDAYGAAVASPGEVCVLLLDLDRFKEVNDSLGHAAGDTVLLTVSRRLREALRPTDVVARLGGDELAAVLVDCHDAALVAERVRDAVAQPMTVAGEVLVPTASIGVARCPDHGPGRSDRAAVVHRADLALYESKAAGRDRVSLAVDV